MTKFEKILISRGLQIPSDILRNILDIAEESENLVIKERNSFYNPYAVFEDNEFKCTFGKISDYPDKKIKQYCKDYYDAQLAWKYYYYNYTE